MVFLSICTALYDYAPQSENELAIEEGELLYIVDKSEEDDWWQAKKKAASEEEEEPTGLIPNNYVEDAHPIHQAKALYDYNRQTDEELSFSEDAVLAVYDASDPEWTLVGLDGEYGFVPANYIDIIGSVEPKSPVSVSSARDPHDQQDSERPSGSTATARSGPAAAIAGILHNASPVAEHQPNLPPRPQQFTPEASDEEPPAPLLPRRPDSQQIDKSVTSQASLQSPKVPTVIASPPQNRAVSQQYDEDETNPKAGGYHLYNISEMVSAMGKSKKLPTTLGINLANGQIMIAPEKSRDGPQQEWTADKLTHYSIEGKHIFMELVRPSKSVDFHAGSKDTAQEIVTALGEIAGATRAEGLREVLEAAGSGSSQKKGQILYDFMAQGEDEVTVAVGDDVIVIDDTKSDDWWMVRRLKNGKEGVVPSSYVEVTGVIAVPSNRSGVNAGKSIVEQNRLEEERLAKGAIRSSKTTNNTGSEVGSGTKLPTRGSSLINDNDGISQRGKKESRSHGRSSSSSKSKPDTAKVRTWTDRSGAFKVEAQFIGLKDAKIHLHKLNGVKIAVPVAKMAIEDLEYVEGVTGVSLDDDKPLSDIKRRSTQGKKEDRGRANSAPKAGASVDRTSQGKPDGPEYDWFDFFLKAGVSPYQCERYAFNFNRDSMDEGVLSDITPAVLRTLGLKEGDILRVMKYLDNKFSRTGVSSPDGAGSGLFAGPGGTLRNNTSKGRPAPPIQTRDTIDAAALQPKSDEDQTRKNRQDSVVTTSSPIGPPPPAKDSNGFDDDAWSVKPSKQTVTAQESPKAPAQPASNNTSKPTLAGSLLDLSLLSAPLQPTPAQPTGSTQAQQVTNQALNQPQQGPAQQTIPSQATGASPSFFSQIQQIPQPGTGLNLGQNPPYQQNLAPQQTGAPRQRPQPPPQNLQPGSIAPPPAPPTRPLSAPQTQQQHNNFSPLPLQPQLTGYQPQNQFAGQVAPPGQSLNDLNQQRYQQQQFQAQQYMQQQAQPLQMQSTGFVPGGQGFNQFNPSIQPQLTGFQAPAFQNPYVIGQQQGSPFADPRGPKPQFATLQSQPTGFQSQPSNLNISQFPQNQFQNPLQPTQTGINSALPPALQPQNTGAVNGFARTSISQGSGASSVPPMPPMPPMPIAAPLQPQKTGPAPSIRFGTQPANKLVPQPTGRKANLSAATPSNPFGF